MRLPDVLEVVIVVHRSAPFDFGKHAPVHAQRHEEIWSCSGHEPVLRVQYLLLAEADLQQENAHQGLDRCALGAMNVGRVDRCGLLFDVASQEFGGLVDPGDLIDLLRGQWLAQVSLVGRRHGRQLRSFRAGEAT